MAKLISDFWPTVIVIIVVVLLASIIVYNSNENQNAIIKSVREAQQAKDRLNSETLEEIRKRIGDDETWRNVQKSLP